MFGPQHMVVPRFRCNTISQTSFWYFPSLHLPWVHSVRSSTYPGLPHSTLKVGTYFTLGKVSVHQEAVLHVVSCRTQWSSVVTPPEAEHPSPSAFHTLCIETFCIGVTSSFLCYWSSMYPSSVTGYQHPPSWSLLKRSSHTHLWVCHPLHAFILNLVAKVKISITLGDLQVPHVTVCVVQGIL